MILFSVLLKWWQPDQFMVSWTVSGGGGSGRGCRSARAMCWVVGSRRTGALHGVQPWQSSVFTSSVGLWHSAAGAVMGTMLGACLGAFVGALLGNLWAGRTLFQSFT